MFPLFYFIFLTAETKGHSVLGRSHSELANCPCHFSNLQLNLRLIHFGCLISLLSGFMFVLVVLSVSKPAFSVVCGFFASVSHAVSRAHRWLDCLVLPLDIIFFPLLTLSFYPLVILSAPPFLSCFSLSQNVICLPPGSCVPIDCFAYLQICHLKVVSELFSSVLIFYH